MGGASKEGHSGFGLFVLKTLTSAIMLIRLERLAIDVIEHFDFFIFKMSSSNARNKLTIFAPILLLGRLYLVVYHFYIYLLFFK